MPSANGHDPKRAIIYCRVSTSEQARSGYSLAQQLEALRAYAAREGYEVLEEVQDPGQSGASLERPGMDRVRDLVAAGGVSAVLAQDRDRIAREPAYHYLLNGPIPSVRAPVRRRGLTSTSTIMRAASQASTWGTWSFTAPTTTSISRTSPGTSFGREPTTTIGWRATEPRAKP